jgi:hypothetical protein
VLLDRLQPFDGRGHVWRAAAAFAPALGACGIGMTRVIDWWHHTTDVLTGLALGFLVSWAAFCCVLQRLGGLGSGRVSVGGGGGGVGGSTASSGGLELGGGGGGGLSDEDAAAVQPLLLRGGLGGAAAPQGGAPLLPV